MPENPISSNEALLAAIQAERKNIDHWRRDRDLEDYNYYLDLDIRRLRDKAIEQHGSFRWVDMCSGSFKAGEDFIKTMGAQGFPVIQARGVDLDTPEPNDKIFHDGSLVISHGNAVDYNFPEKADLITCVNGLYLVDQFYGEPGVLQAVSHWYDNLRRDGMIAIMRRGDNTLAGKIKNHLSITSNQIREQDNILAVLPDGTIVKGHPEHHCYIKLTKKIN